MNGLNLIHPPVPTRWVPKLLAILGIALLNACGEGGPSTSGGGGKEEAVPKPDDSAEPGGAAESSGCMRGQLACRCFGNSTCDRGLTCFANKCVADDEDIKPAGSTMPSSLSSMPSPAVSELVAEADAGTVTIIPTASTNPTAPNPSDEPPAESSSAPEPTTEETTQEDSTPPTPSDDSADASTDDTNTDLGATPAFVGEPCASDADCTGGLCLLEGDGGTIAGGLCTLDCAADPNVCGYDALCVGPIPADSNASYCQRLCLLADGYAECNQNPNSMCVRLDPDTDLGLCHPRCNKDADCPGQYCDRRASGLCIDAPPSGLGDGEPCSTNEECVGGYCMVVRDATTGVCSTECNLLPEAHACYRSPDDTTPADAICFDLISTLLLGQTSDQYEQGQCYPTCDTDEECPGDWLCLEGSDRLEAELGRAGMCFPEVYL
jgi:hypothetical protein